MSSNDIKADEVPSGGQNQNEKKRFNNKKQNNNNNNNHNHKTKFEGRCDDLKGHVYDYGESKNADQFVQTTKEIKNYIGRTYKHGGDITAAISAMAVPTTTEPTEPTDPSDRIAMKKWEREYDDYFKAKKILTENVKTLYNLVWGQCSEAMQQKIESLDNFSALESTNNGIELLLAIKNTSYDYQSQKYRIESVIEALYRLMTLRQGQHNSPHHYYEQFTNLLAVYIHCGGSEEPDIGCLEFVIEKKGWDKNAITAEQKAEVREMMWANLFIIHADRGRYGGLITGLQNDYLTGNDNYPKTLTETYSRLSYWKDTRVVGRGNQASNDGVTFTNVGGNNGNNGGKKNPNKYPHITCFNCNKKGHYSSDCPDEQTGETHATTNQTTAEEPNATLVTTGAAAGEFDGDENIVSSFQFMINGHNLTNTSSTACIPSTWILLDNQSTIDVFCNKTLLHNVQSTHQSMNIHCNAGSTTTTQIGILPGYGEVWYHPTGIANILSLSRVRDRGYKIEYDNENNWFIIHKPDGKVHKFIQSDRGLYYLDTAGTPGLDTVLVNTVEQNKSKFSNRDYLRAVDARQLLCKIGRPSQKTFLNILDRNLLPNCPVTRRDALNAELIFWTRSWITQRKNRTSHRGWYTTHTQ